MSNYIIIKMVCKNWGKEEESDTVGGMKIEEHTKMVKAVGMKK